MSRPDSMQLSDAPRTASRREFVLGASALAIAASPVSRAMKSQGRSRGKVFAYVGSDTGAIDGNANGKGIYLFEMDSSSGKLSLVKLAAEAKNPSWLCLDPSQKYLYTVNETANFEGKSGSVSAYAVDPSSHDLRLLNQVSSQGAGPAYVSLDATGKYVFVANYGGGSIAVSSCFAGRIAGRAHLHASRRGQRWKPKSDQCASGKFCHQWTRQTARPHDRGRSWQSLCIANGSWAGSPLRLYLRSADTGKLAPAATPFASLPSGDGPRHFAFHPNGRWLYSIQEEGSTVVFFHFDPATGSMAAQQTVSSLPDGFAGTSFASGIRVSGDGRTLYAANRLHNTIAVFSIDNTGHLKHVGDTPTLGDYPPQFNIDPSGNFLYVCNQRSDQITCFRIDKRTGLLHFTGQYTPVGTPTCIIFTS